MLDELPRAGLGRRGEVAGDGSGARVLEKGVELDAYAGGRSIPRRLGQQLPAFAQLGAQRPLLVPYVIGHATDSTVSDGAGSPK